MTSATLDRAPLSHARLPRFAPFFVLGVAIVVSVLLGLLLGWNYATMAIIADLLFLAALPAWSALLEGRRAATDRFVTALIWSMFAVVCVPLVWVIAEVIRKGAPKLTGHFLSTSMRNVPVGVGAPGGVLNSIEGTLLITLFAAIIAIPLGLLTAIYLVEYGRGSRLARIITFLVDVMTGIPSIVAGLFALALFVLIFGPAVQMGFEGSVALSLLMTPTVVRSSEEMLRLVPTDLREASYALGVPKWRTILKVVVPTSIGGIVTGIMLAISRVIGETAPLMVLLTYNPGMNGNVFSGPMGTLPTFIFNQYHTPEPPPRVPLGTLVQPPSASVGRMWAAALVLILIVMILNLVARVVGKIFAPKTGR